MLFGIDGETSKSVAGTSRTIVRWHDGASQYALLHRHERFLLRCARVPSRGRALSPRQQGPRRLAQSRLQRPLSAASTLASRPSNNLSGPIRDTKPPPWQPLAWLSSIVRGPRTPRTMPIPLPTHPPRLRTLPRRPREASSSPCPVFRHIGGCHFCLAEKPRPGGQPASRRRSRT